jgi:hypothetical protein
MIGLVHPPLDHAQGFVELGYADLVMLAPLLDVAFQWPFYRRSPLLMLKVKA